MPSISLTRADIPFLLGGTGTLTVNTGSLALNSPVPSDGSALFDVAFKASGADTMTLGQAGTVKIGVSTSASARGIAVFRTSTGASKGLLEAQQLGAFFEDPSNADRMVVAFDLGASAAASAAATFVYQPLTATVTVDAGADGGYSYLRAFDRSTPLGKVLPAFFASMKLPEQLTQPPQAGEAVSLRYGGYLRLGAEVAAGYELAGTKAFSVSQLALSERYRLSILGKIGLSAGVAGRFAITVTAGDRAGWARVRVTRHRASDLRVAADVTVDFANELDGLPADPYEFLGAVLGVNGKSFVNVLQRVRELGKYDTVSAAIDGLAKLYLGELIGRGFDILAAKTSFDEFLARVNRVVTSYETLEDRAVALFDRYFDQLPVLTDFLDALVSLDARDLEDLRGRLTPVLFNILSQLSDGDPLGFLLGRIVLKGEEVDSLPELKGRARSVLALIRDEAHKDIRDAIAAAKKSFRADVLFREAAKIDTVDELKALATDKVGLFVSRLVGRSLDSSANVKAAFDELKLVLSTMDTFTSNLFKAVREATGAAYRLGLHAEYSRATERDALVDVSINLGDPQGAPMLAQAARGDFHAVLTTRNTNVVRLNEGVLTHRTHRESKFKVNIIGWHVNYSYEGFDRVITESEQRLAPSDRGILILSTTKLEVARGRKRQDEEMHLAFVLLALGQSAGAVKGDRRTLEYAIDTLSSLTASYELAFTDADTSPGELDDYLAFAADLGLDRGGATLAALDPFLPRAANGGYGRIETSYDVRLGRSAVRALLTVKQLSARAESAIRQTLRNMVLANYLKGDLLHDVAFAYATPAVFATFTKLGAPAFTNVLSPRVFPIAIGMGVAAPAQVSLDRMELNLLATLYGIENSMVDALRGLIRILNAGDALAPSAFEKKLAKFGSVLIDFDKFDQATRAHGVGTNTIFAVFDALVRLASGATPANLAVLHLKSTAANRNVEKLFMTDAAADAQA
jgi:hypothetical protein